ncbi:MAG: hypothetical protein HYX68_07490 [Planctomycetes bacterium]|nr:hypothetical protein [Planctomycetota bacterium]
MRNRILRHVRIRAGDLVPHELNPRVHSDAQRRALQMLYDEIGFARSLLAYPLADGRLKLIDGHLRAALTPEEEVDVEVLDVTDAEARALLMAIDPLAQLAGYEADTLDKLRHMVEEDSAAVKSLWQTLQEASERTRRDLQRLREGDALPEQFFVLVECDDEEHQRDLLARFKTEGLTCQAKMS